MQLEGVRLRVLPCTSSPSSSSSSSSSAPVSSLYGDLSRKLLEQRFERRCQI